MHAFPWWLEVILSTDFLISMAVIIIILMGIAVYYGIRYFKDDHKE